MMMPTVISCLMPARMEGDASIAAITAQELLEQHGPAYNVNLQVFYSLQRTITGWPGGKPDKALVSST